MIIYLIVINILTFLIYGMDKWKAKKGWWRISEDTFLYVEFTGFDRERTEGILASLFESDESPESTQINE